MERFVQLVVLGGLACVAGLWSVRLSGTGSPPWLAGAGLVAVGLASMAAGIGRELDVAA